MKRSYTLNSAAAADAKAQVDDMKWPGGPPVLLGDFGNRLRISGILFQGENHNLLLAAPTAQKPWSVIILQPTLETWCRIIRQTDDPVIFEEDDTGTIKAVHRKVQHQISGGTQWAIWERDDFRCLYCGRHGGKGCPLTIDHFVPLSRGGANDPSNYVSCCKRCAKSKGSREPQEWCDAQSLDYFGLTEYLAGRAPRSFIAHL
ncbi:MAG: HNH endonuclease [Promethearchaeota archaeon]